MKKAAKKKEKIFIKGLYSVSFIKFYGILDYLHVKERIRKKKQTKYSRITQLYPVFWSINKRSKTRTLKLACQVPTRPFLFHFFFFSFSLSLNKYRDEKFNQLFWLLRRDTSLSFVSRVSLCTYVLIYRVFECSRLYTRHARRASLFDQRLIMASVAAHTIKTRKTIFLITKFTYVSKISLV